MKFLAPGTAPDAASKPAQPAWHQCTPINVPLGGFGNCPVFGELTTPAGGKCLLLGPTTRIRLKSFVGTLSWLIAPAESTTTPRKYFAGLTGNVTAEPEIVTTLLGWLMICLANVL